MISDLNKLYITLFAILPLGCSAPEEAIIWDQQEDESIDPTQGLAGGIIGTSQGKLILAGGANFPERLPWQGGTKMYHSAVYIFNFDDGKLNLRNTSELETPCAYTANSPYKKGFVAAGGENNKGAVENVNYYFLDNNKFKQQSLPSLPVALTNGSLTNSNQTLYFVGGENQGGVSNIIWKLSEGAKEWTEFAALSRPLSHAVVLSDDAHIYIIGGRSKREEQTSIIYPQSYRINIETKEIDHLPHLPVPLAAGTGVMQDNGKIWLFGGDDGSTFTKVEELLIQIEHATDREKKERLVAQKDSLQISHPGFNRTILSLNSARQEWVEETEMPYELPVTTSAVLQNGEIIIPNGEIKAGIRSHQFVTGKWTTK